MAALWLQSVSLLVLLVVSWPSTQAAPSPQHLCGSHLVDALQFVCEDRGFFYNLKRDPDQVKGASGMKKVRETMPSVLELCCFNTCTLADLENFCN